MAAVWLRLQSDLADSTSTWHRWGAAAVVVCFWHSQHLWARGCPCWTWL